MLLRYERDVGHADRALSRLLDQQADCLAFFARHLGLDEPGDRLSCASSSCPLSNPLAVPGHRCRPGAASPGRAVVYVLGRERVAPLVSEEGFPFLAAED